MTCAPTRGWHSRGGGTRIYVPLARLTRARRAHTPSPIRRPVRAASYSRSVPPSLSLAVCPCLWVPGCLSLCPVAPDVQRPAVGTSLRSTLSGTLNPTERTGTTTVRDPKADDGSYWRSVHPSYRLSVYPWVSPCVCAGVDPCSRITVPAVATPCLGASPDPSAPSRVRLGVYLPTRHAFREGNPPPAKPNHTGTVRSPTHPPTKASCRPAASLTAHRASPH